MVPPCCASSAYPTLGIPARPPPDEGSLPEETQFQKKRKEARLGRWKGKGPSAALHRDKGACLPLPGIPQETVSLILGLLGQGQTVCH